MSLHSSFRGYDKAQMHVRVQCLESVARLHSPICSVLRTSSFVYRPTSSRHGSCRSACRHHQQRGSAAALGPHCVGYCWSSWARRAARFRPHRPLGALRPRTDPRARGARQGGGRVRLLRGHARHGDQILGLQALLVGGEAHARGSSLLDRRGRAGQRRHGPRPSRARHQVLHRGGQLGPRGQQHADLLHPRPDPLPELHPHAEAPAQHAPQRRQHDVGLLLAASGDAAPADLPLLGPRHPDGHRHMNGYGSHAFVNVNAQGEVTYVKYHFKTDQGIRNLPVDEAASLASGDPDYALRDLYNAIERQNFPTWTLYIQTMTPDQAAAESVNPFDVTKIWPHRSYPLQEVGRLVLNRNPKNYFAEVEQLAFSPSHMVPGIEPSPDKMLQGRLFSYPDTQRHRLGPNFQQIPVNKPLHEPRTYQRDGFMTVDGNMADAPNYFPNSVGGPLEADTLRYHAYQGEHSVVDKYSTADDDNFSQVGEFYRKTLDTGARERLTDNIAGSLVNASKPVQARAVANFCKADPDYGLRVQEKLDTLEQARATQQKSKVRVTEPLNPPRKAFKAVGA